MNNRGNKSNQEIIHRIYATFILRGKELDPLIVTEQLGIKPSRSFKRGDNRTEQKKWPHGYWELTSDKIIDSPDLSTHIEWIIVQLDQVHQKLLEILNDKNIFAEISCFWILPTGHDELTIKPDLLERIASFGLELDLDIYCP